MNNTPDFRQDAASREDVVSHLRGADRSFIPPLSDRVDIEAYAAKLLHLGTRWEAWAGTRLVGLVAGYLNDRETGSGFISSVSVTPGWQGKGIGSKLIVLFIASAYAAGTKKLALEVHRNNNAAIQVYKAAGFSEESHNGEMITMCLKPGAAI